MTYCPRWAFYRRTPLHWAAAKGNEDVAELLIGQGADVNAKDEKGRTPLHYIDDKDTAELLIAKGADVSAKGKYGNTPLHHRKSAFS